MWCVLFGTFLILTGCAGMFIANEAEIAAGLAALGVALLVWGVVQLLHPREDEDIPESDEPLPPLPHEMQEPRALPTDAPPSSPLQPPPHETAATQETIPITTDLTAEEMEKGCSKRYTIHGRHVEVQLPPGMKAGKCLQIETIYGTLALVIQSKEPPAAVQQGVHISNAPQEPPSPYKRGLRYLYAMDRISGHKKAASCFIEGYEQGDLNAGYMLCHCYREGKGVPVKPAFVVQLAEYLVKRRYYPAYWHLAVAYREGWGVPMNMALSAEYAGKFEEMCATPLDGVEELMRYDALLNHELHKDKPDLRVLEKLARENYNLSRLPSRYSLLALTLLRDAHCSASAEAELQYLLDEGCRSDDMGSFYLKGLLLCYSNTLLYPKDEKRGLEYLRLAAEHLGTPVALLSYLRLSQDAAQSLHTLDNFWSACRWGISGVKGSDELHCHISVAVPGLPVGDKAEADKETQPRLIIVNKDEQTLHSAVLRICCIDKKLDVSVKLAPLAPGESVSIRPEDHGLELGRRLYVEVHKDGRSSRMYLHQVELLRDFAARS